MNQVHPDFNVFEYIKFLKNQTIVMAKLLREAAEGFDYIAAGQLQNDISTIGWVIDDLTKFAKEGKHL